MRNTEALRAQNFLIMDQGGQDQHVVASTAIFHRLIAGRPVVVLDCRGGYTCLVRSLAGTRVCITREGAEVTRFGSTPLTLVDLPPDALDPASVAMSTLLPVLPAAEMAPFVLVTARAVFKRLPGLLAWLTQPRSDKGAFCGAVEPLLDIDLTQLSLETPVLNLNEYVPTALAMAA